MSSFSFESLFGKESLDLAGGGGGKVAGTHQPTLPFSFQIQKFLNLKQVFRINNTLFSFYLYLT